MSYPKLDYLNPVILELIKQYPTDGTHDYYWDASKPTDGVTMEVRYRGEVIARPDAERRTYCSGLTFEVYMTACERYARLRGFYGFKLGDLTPWGVRKLKSDWYVATGMRGGPLDAIVPRGLGVEIKSVEDALPGDFVQLWRPSGSGHSVIFLENKGEKIRYWSTQPSTVGIGEREEAYSEIYIARAFPPRPVSSSV